MTELRLALGEDGTLTGKDGIAYPTGPTSLEVMAEWEDSLFNETLQRLKRSLAKDPNGEMKALKTVAEMSAEGSFDFYGETSQKRIWTPSGIKRLLFFRIKQKSPDVLKKATDAIIDEIMAEDFRKQYEKELAAMDAILPNAEAPTGAELA